MAPYWLTSAISTWFLSTLQAAAFDNSRSDNLAVYWGQNSYGATHLSDTANWQQQIGFYCQDDSIDAIPIAFLNVFSDTGGYPSINIANICNVDDDGVFTGTSLAKCSFLASQIEFCQSRGKIVTLSLGGATGAASFSSAAQAQAFGDTIWNLFLGGTSNIRPFGDAVLDGIDLDIEGGSTVYFDSFINRIRALASGASKQYYVTAAPQCPYPDAYLGTVLNAVAFDAVYVQFYNNWCGLQNYDNIWAWDFASWDTWAKTVAVNSNMKVYIGAPASSTAAGAGYVDAATLANIALETRSQYSSFGGVMLWDASQAYGVLKTSLEQPLRHADQERNPHQYWRLQLEQLVVLHTRVDFELACLAFELAGLEHVRVDHKLSRLDHVCAVHALLVFKHVAELLKFHSGIFYHIPHPGFFHEHQSIHEHLAVLVHIPCDQHLSHVFFSRITQQLYDFTAIAYVGGNQVSYNGHLWTAKWWSYNDVPGGPAGVWTDDGPC
ncbi:glycoside hydrolase [Trametes versicolor FP-101664 SS1]|uniref:glycoside hydrolase n=1 Tax=Trametes versicolor (strain FP-101664) TaxID=717944 RepID=UPI0004622EA8|nr:glycoside hydrolase [Trametes versicolor FP-101664 SS1]EIW57149.1 glycoside hydrolase [Trametes versicolor FP-101664 SS1]